MTMQWKKIGQIFCPSGEKKWMQTHAALPIAEHLCGDLFKIYFSSRDVDNKSYTGYIVIDLCTPNKILSISDSPVIAPGMMGEFDDSGATASWLTVHEDKRFLYYVGWNLGVTVPFRNSIGLTVSNTANNGFFRYASGPIVDRSLYEPHFCGSCCVLKGEDHWRMWYLSCVGWDLYNGEPRHRYHIKYAESLDGIHWRREGIVAIDFANSTEYAISRPSVIYENEKWKMWYSVRGKSYRIGYAESDNGREWKRLDTEAGINVSNLGWDSEMIEYPFVFDHMRNRYMLYNGNGYGKTGFGLAVLEKI